MKYLNRKFGIELELIGGAVDRPAVAAALNAAGIDTYVAGYTHATTPQWKIVTDASLHGINAMELVSPILEGRDGFKQIKKVCKVLNRIGVTVNTSCGFHVHVDARGASPLNIANLLRMWAKTEAASFDVLAPTRIGNRWAKRVFSNDLAASYQRIAEAVRASRGGSVESLIWRFTTDRYMSLNLTAFMRHGSVEFRSHQGTTDAAKICAWVELCVTMVGRSFSLAVAAHARILGGSQFDYCLYGLSSRTAKFLRDRRAHFASRRAA
jgi:hypothetical protein